jgi:hypothetical protein
MHLLLRHAQSAAAVKCMRQHPRRSSAACTHGSLRFSPRGERGLAKQTRLVPQRLSNAAAMKKSAHGSSRARKAGYLKRHVRGAHEKPVNACHQLPLTSSNGTCSRPSRLATALLRRSPCSCSAMRCTSLASMLYELHTEAIADCHRTQSKNASIAGRSPLTTRSGSGRGGPGCSTK